MADPNVDARTLLAESLFNNPETREPFLRLIKRAHPQAPIPELDVRDAIRAEVKPVQEALEKEREENRKERNARWLEEQRAAIRGTVGEQNIPAVEKLMQDEAIGNHKAAAELWQARQEVAAPSSPQGWGTVLSVPGLHGAGGEDFKTIMTDPQWANKRAYETLDLYRKGKLSEYGQ